MKLPKISLVDWQAPMPGNAVRRAIAGLAIVALCVVAVVLIVLVGHKAHPPIFDWSAAVDAGTAVGTTFLALATVWLALEGRAERQHTRAMIQIQERDEERKDKAWLFVVSATAHYPSGQANPVNATAEVQLANAGQGPAVQVAVSLQVWGERRRGSGLTTIAQKVIPILMPLSTVTIRLYSIGSSPIFQKDVSDLICIDVQYRDKLTMTGMFREAEPFWDIAPRPPWSAQVID